jgi:hypothetical protein
MDIGPCQVYWDGDDLGGTLGNVTINFKYEKAPFKADQTGSALLDEAISGMEVTVETEFTQTRDKVLLSKLFPDATLGGTSPNQFLDFKDSVAARQLVPNAKILKLHPIVEADASENYDWVFWKAVPSEESTYVFSPSDQAKMKIVWKVYLDLSVTPGRIFRMGDDDL